MSSHYRFRVVRWIDFLTFGLAAILSAGTTVWAAATPGNPLVGLIVAAGSSVGFVLVYALILARRFAFSREIAYVTNDGLVVMKSQWTPIRVLVEKETGRVLRAWETAVSAERDGRADQQAPQHAPHDSKLGPDGLPVVRRALRGVVVRWANAPFEMHVRPGFKWMGLTAPSGRSMMVGRVDPLERSAFGHEVGHVILMVWRGDGSEATLKRFHDEYATPY